MVVMGQIITLAKPYRQPGAYEVGEFGEAIPTEWEDAEHIHLRKIEGETWVVARQVGTYWDRTFKPYKVKA